MKKGLLTLNEALNLKEDLNHVFEIYKTSMLTMEKLNINYPIERKNKILITHRILNSILDKSTVKPKQNKIEQSYKRLFNRIFN